MSNFDPRKPITDPSVFAPRGMYVDNRNPNKRVGNFNGGDNDDTKAFIFNSSDMKALNRFLGTGRRLHTTRREYLRWLGIEDKPGEISTALGKELDILLGTYSSIKKDCVQFKDVTWIRIVEIAGDIKTYATMSGGREETSYYVIMLNCIGKYHDEKNKPNPDQATLGDLKATIQFTVDAELKKLDELQAGAAEALTGLGNFERVCEQHSIAIETNVTTLSNQLTKEGNDIKTMRKKIDEANNEIKDLQGRIDGKNKVISDAPWYMWVNLIGMAIGTAMIVRAKQEREAMLAAMEKVQKLLDEYENKMRTAMRLETNLTFISDQVKDLGAEIGPAMRTLQKLQGAWKNMETDLKSIKDLIEFDIDNIPPMLITQAQLLGIVDEWNELRDYASSYIENAYLRDNPKSVTIKEYINELETAIKTIEGMQAEEVKD